MRIAVAVDAYSATALPGELPASVHATQRPHTKTFVREEAASLAAAAASMTSVLRRLPRDSSRTRAVAVHGTSSTISPRATSH